MKRIKGKSVSPGIEVGKALIYSAQKQIILQEHISPENVEKEIQRFNSSVRRSKNELKKIRTRLGDALGSDSALIIETQYLLLESDTLKKDVVETIKQRAVTSEWAIKEIEKKYTNIFKNIPDLSFRQKQNDIQDILNRLLKNLKKPAEESEPDIDNVILVADDLPPSEAAKIMSSGRLIGLILNQGSDTSHTVILARTLEIPILVNTGNATEIIANGDELIIDAISGEIIVKPGKLTLSETSIKREKYQRYKRRLKRVSKLPDITLDQQEFNLYANIELPFECEIALSYGAKGIGLFRTEFLFSDPEVSQSEEEQFLIYKNLAQAMYPHPAVIRTFDVGRDKYHEYFSTGHESNPALGSMAIRLFLQEPELLKIQLKAILRANQSGNIRLLFPMVTEIEEIFALKRIIIEAESELREGGKLPDKRLQLGIMIEIPGTVKLIRHLKGEVDFFSIGTNDLLQYLLAVDRNNSDLSYLFNPYHPALVAVLNEIGEETRKISLDVTICGEIAGQPFTALMLLGMGFRHFSMNPYSIAEIKRIFTRIHVAHLEKIVRKLSTFSSKGEVEEFLIESLLRKYPDLFVSQPLL